MRNVTISTVLQPAANSVHSTKRAASFSIVQIGMPSGRHCQNSSNSARLAHRTYVERSIAHGTIRVQRSLNQRRAITLCWTANTVSSAQSIASALSNEPSSGPSSRRGTRKPPTNAIA